MKGKNLVISLTMGAIVAALFAITAVNFVYRSEMATGTQLLNDLEKLKGIFSSINAQCKILSFDAQQNPINFLNVGSFKGSEVGSMNLAYPEKWQGPYVEDNLTIQDKEYMIVKTDAGHFITPGNGVSLPNGKRIGTDIIVDKQANIQGLIDGKQLSYQGKPLAVSIEVGDSLHVAYPEAWQMKE